MSNFTSRESRATKFADIMRYTEGPDGDWLNPINLNKISVAVTFQKKTVELDGRTYNITYNPPQDRDAVYLSRADGGIVPQGYIEIHRLRHFDFEGESG